jgi:hypothetical protein
MIGNDDTVTVAQRLGQVAVVERPARVAVHHNHRVTLALVEVVVSETVQLEEIILKGVEITHYSLI